MHWVLPIKYWDQGRYSGQCQWTKYILYIFNLFFAAQPSYWDALSNIKHLPPSMPAIGRSTYCMSLTMTEWGIPVTGMHSGLWLMHWDQCHWGLSITYWDQCMYWRQSHWTKYVLHIFNLFCVVHPSCWDVLSDINYLLKFRVSHHLLIKSPPSKPLDEAHIACL